VILLSSPKQFAKGRTQIEGVDNRALRRMFETNRDEVAGGWTKFHNVELHSLYSLPIIIRMIKWRRMRLAGHVARMGR
jgi:hypothetical protein